MITVRPLAVADVTDRYVDWLNDPVVVQFLDARFSKQTRESVEKFVSDLSASPDNCLLGAFFDGVHVGNVRIGPIDRNHRFADIGMLLGERDLWGNGLGTELVRLGTEYAFNVLKVHKLIAGIAAVNPASHKAFLACGYREAGIWKRHVKFDGVWLDRITVEKENPAFLSEP